VISHPAKEKGIGLADVLDRVTMQLFIRGYDTMIAAPVQSDVDRISKGSHTPDYLEKVQQRTAGLI